MQADIKWKKCATLPCNSGYGNAVVLKGKVYYGGGIENDLEDESIYTVYCYDILQDKWSNLPPLQVSSFGLGQMNGKLVTVGGVKKEKTNELHTFMEQKQKWKQTIPPMPTPRNSPGVLSLPTSLIVAGGYKGLSYYANAVEIFKPDLSQWYTTDPLPTPCNCISFASISNMCYALGGYQSPIHLNQALYASVDDLFLNAVPANQTTHNDRSDSRSVWRSLPNTPKYAPSAGVLTGNLLAIGGISASRPSVTSTVNKEVYVHSPSTSSWIYISDLPGPYYNAAVAAVSPTEILVIGGLIDSTGHAANTVYKGFLHIKV